MSDELRQHIDFHMADGKIWGLNITVSDCLGLLEALYDEDYSLIKIVLEDDHRQWHLSKDYIVGVTISDLEDVMEVSGAERSVSRPPKKSRCAIA